MLELIKKNDKLHKELDQLRNSGNTIGFVPTLGALHNGHISLINKALEYSDIVVCSIFVNPTQFNEKSDFDRYPRPLSKDMKMLDKNNCHILYLPDEKEIYPKGFKSYAMSLGDLGKVMEGGNRPGHFNGVVEVVHRLLDIVKPDFAFFGEKDFQQLAIIRKLVKTAKLKTEIIPCPIIRESDGLAMSSRNRLLSREQRQKAPILFKVLKKVSKNTKKLSPTKVKQWARELLLKENVSLEYIEIVKEEDLQPINKWYKRKACRVFIAARFGEIRLIDNMVIVYRPK